MTATAAERTADEAAAEAPPRAPASAAGPAPADPADGADPRAQAAAAAGRYLDLWERSLADLARRGPLR